MEFNLVGVGGLIIAAIGLVWKILTTKKLEDTSDYKGIVGNMEIYNILHEIKKETNAQIVSLGSVSNGGGQIKAGMPLHMRLHFSTDQSTLELYTEKAMLSGVLLKYYADVLKNNDTCFHADLLESKLAKEWSAANGIKQTCMFYVSICVGERIYVLFLNFTDEDHEIIGNKYLFVIQKIAEINKLITSEHKWWTRKKKIVQD